MSVTTATIFLFLLAAHFCGDWLGYSPEASGSKRNKAPKVRLQAIGWHCLKHAGWSFLWLVWLGDLRLMFYAGLYVFIIHFCIDFIRIRIEEGLFDPAEFRILKRREVFNYLIGSRGCPIDTFMDKYLRRWALLNIADLTAHVASLALFAGSHTLLWGF